MQQNRVRRKPVGSVSTKPSTNSDTLDCISKETAINNHRVNSEPACNMQGTAVHPSPATFFAPFDVETKSTYFPPPKFRGSTWAASIASESNANVLNYAYTNASVVRSSTQPTPQVLMRSLSGGITAQYAYPQHFPPHLPMTRGYSDSMSQWNTPYHFIPNQTSPMAPSYFPSSPVSYTNESPRSPNTQPPSLFNVDKPGQEFPTPPLSPSNTLSSAGTGRSRRSSRQILAPMATMVGDIKASTSRGLKTLPLSKMKVPPQIKYSKNTKKLIWTGARWVIKIGSMSLGSDFDIGDCDFGGGEDVVMVGEDGAGEDVLVVEEADGDVYVVEEGPEGDVFAMEDGGGDAALVYEDTGAGDLLGASYEDGMDAGAGAGMDAGIEESNEDSGAPPEQAPPAPEALPAPVPYDPAMGMEAMQTMSMNMSTATWAPLQSCAAMPAI